eukprot:TRINITY_DN45417_c1_g1_i2.p1 TRINITY_DN45417_c1_g1~~TRINITY_DN45417_c1_g1_i2.p1  ORF type:complete len:145 (+),score=9.96 TRINITY_DN45417_c1_g1_i2:293-727(+)
MIREELKSGKLGKTRDQRRQFQKQETWDTSSIEQMVKTVVNSLASSCININDSSDVVRTQEKHYKNDVFQEDVSDSQSSCKNDEEDDQPIKILNEFTDRPWMKYLTKNVHTNFPNSKPPQFKPGNSQDQDNPNRINIENNVLCI